MNRIFKTLLPLTLALGLGVTGCASASPRPDGSAAAESPASSASASVSTPAESSEALVAHAQELSGLYGKDYPGFVYQDKEGDAILYDSSKVPAQVLGSTVADFDGDGQEELIAAVLNDDHSFRLELYQEQNGQVNKTDTLDLSTEWAEIPQSIGTPDYTSIADFFTYGEDAPLVGLEISQMASVFADGVALDFFSVSCRNGVLKLEGHASCGGSDGLYNETYMAELAKLGAYPLWNEVFAQTQYVRDCLENYTDFARISTSYSVDWEEANEWLESGREPLECSSIHFASPEELAENTKATRAAYQPHSPHADALQAYAAAVNHFCFDRVWPDGEKLSDIDDEFYDFYKNHYAIADVDADGEPELILQLSEADMATQMEQVWDYDSASGNLRCELIASIYNAYYDNGVVKVNASHNHTPSEFWPFTLFRYNGDSGEFEDAGSVYAHDKDSEWSGDEPFPAEADKDGDGRVFYLNEDAAVDNAAYEEWETSILGGAKELTIDWHELDYEQFDSIMRWSDR